MCKCLYLCVNALEARLKFPLHPFSLEFLQWRRISPSQIVPNSWSYLIVFIRECYYFGINLTLNLFTPASKSIRADKNYLTAWEAFTMRGAPTSNKG